MDKQQQINKLVPNYAYVADMSEFVPGSVVCWIEQDDGQWTTSRAKIACDTVITQDGHVSFTYKPIGYHKVYHKRWNPRDMHLFRKYTYEEQVIQYATAGHK